VLLESGSTCLEPLAMKPACRVSRLTEVAPLDAGPDAAPLIAPVHMQGAGMEQAPGHPLGQQQVD
jgi:hypothetical protein